MITCAFENGNQAKLRHVVVHAIVEADGKLLLVKRAQTLSLEAGKWALPGGFLDRDENAEEAALRELREESGWEGKIISMFRINTDPNRPHEDRQNVAIDFLIAPIRKTGKEDSETAEVSWVPLRALPPFESFAFDHGDSIRYYLSYRSKHFPLPLI